MTDGLGERRRQGFTGSNGLPTMAIVTPSFNQATYLADAIESVLDQREPDVQYAVVDGGSTDGSVGIIERYAKHLTYWVSESDAGQSDAIVKGFGKVDGEVRGWLNSDDVYAPGAFRRVREAFRDSPEAVTVYGERILIDQDSHVVGWSAYPPFDPALAGYTVASECAFWQTSAEDAVGPIDTSLRFAMDLDFFSRLYLHGPFIKTNSYLGMFRCHPASKSATIRDVGDIEAAERWQRYFGSENQNWAVAPRLARGRHLVAGLRHPLLLGLPYARFKIRSGFGG